MKGFHLISFDLDENLDWITCEGAEIAEQAGRFLRLRAEFEQWLADRGDVE